MKDQADNKTDDLFPVELSVEKLVCTSTALKRKKEETRVSLRFEGYTNARFETDLSNDDYLNAAGELLVRLCCEDSPSMQNTRSNNFVKQTQAQNALV
jgi:hypothetical protein